MEAHLFAHEAFDLALVDLNHFKAFNDAYGFAAGDQLVRRTADLLREALAEHAPGQAVLGHAGGDDFLALLPPGPAATICPAVIERFDALVGELAAPGDLARGQVETISRQGSTECHPLVSIAIAVVPYRGEPRVHPARLLQSAAEIRRYLKAQPGSHYLIDRRRPGLPPA
jgi:diguanylate cyclase (GGDEF)-like protein